MAYRLATGVTYCECDRHLVLLDAPQDRYRRLGQRAAETLRRLARREPADADGVAALRRLRVIVEDPDERHVIAPVSVQAAARSALEEDAGGEAASLMEVAADLASAWLAHKLRPFDAALAQVEASRLARALRDITEAQLIDAAAAFERLRRLMPIERKCLPDSLALMRFLHRRGLDASLVIAVKLNPFQAHCWLQSGDVALNEAVDKATLYTPVRIV